MANKRNVQAASLYEDEEPSEVYEDEVLEEEQALGYEDEVGQEEEYAQQEQGYEDEETNQEEEEEFTQLMPAPNGGKSIPRRAPPPKAAAAPPPAKAKQPRSRAPPSAKTAAPKAAAKRTAPAAPTAAPAKARAPAPQPSASGQPPAKRRAPNPLPQRPAPFANTIDIPKQAALAKSQAQSEDGGKAQTPIYNVHATVDKYLNTIASTYTVEELKQHFPEGCYLGNFDLPNVLLSKFDPKILKPIMRASIKGDKRQNKIFLRQFQAYKLAEFLASKGINHVVGFASENSKMSAGAKITEPLAGGEKRDDEPHLPTDKVAKVVYIGESFTYPGEKPASYDTDPSAQQKKAALFSIKSSIIFFDEQQRKHVNRTLVEQETKEIIASYEALSK